MSDHFCPRHGRASRPVLIPGLRCDCLKNESMAVRHHLELCRSLLAPLSSQERVQVLVVLGHDGALEERP